MSSLCPRYTRISFCFAFQRTSVLLLFRIPRTSVLLLFRIPRTSVICLFLVGSASQASWGQASQPGRSTGWASWPCPAKPASRPGQPSGQASKPASQARHRLASQLESGRLGSGRLASRTGQAAGWPARPSGEASQPASQARRPGQLHAACCMAPGPASRPDAGQPGWPSNPAKWLGRARSGRWPAGWAWRPARSAGLIDQVGSRPGPISPLVGWGRYPRLGELFRVPRTADQLKA